MSEDTQHDRPAEATTEAHLGALLLEATSVVERGVETAAARDIAFAADMRQHPGDEALAALTDQLLGHCAALATAVGRIPAEQQSVRTRAAVEVWEQLKTDGPGDGALGNWSYCRHLGRAGRDLLAGIREYRTAQRQAGFVGRPGLPPVRTDTP